MRYQKLCVVVACVLALGGCASNKVASSLSADLWQDQAFQYQPALVTETRETIFCLDATLVQDLKAVDRIGFATERRMDILLSRLYGPNGIRLAYTSGHTTGASQTWPRFPFGTDNNIGTRAEPSYANVLRYIW